MRTQDLFDAHVCKLDIHIHWQSWQWEIQNRCHTMHFTLKSNEEVETQ
jgi:hypothetical protein